MTGRRSTPRWKAAAEDAQVREGEVSSATAKPAKVTQEGLLKTYVYDALQQHHHLQHQSSSPGIFQSTGRLVSIFDASLDKYDKSVSLKPVQISPDEFEKRKFFQGRKAFLHKCAFCNNGGYLGGGCFGTCTCGKQKLGSKRGRQGKRGPGRMAGCAKGMEGNGVRFGCKRGHKGFGKAEGGPLSRGAAETLGHVGRGDPRPRKGIRLWWAPSTRQGRCPQVRRGGKEDPGKQASAFPLSSHELQQLQQEADRALRRLARFRGSGGSLAHLHPHPHPQWSRLVMRQWAKPAARRKFPRGSRRQDEEEQPRKAHGEAAASRDGRLDPTSSTSQLSSRLWQRASPPRTRPRTAAFAGRLLRDPPPRAASLRTSSRRCKSVYSSGSH